MPESSRFLRLLRQGDVRNISFIELLFVIIFTSLLIFSSSLQDLSVARQEIADKDNAIARAQRELSELKDPQRLSRLVSIEQLTVEERRLRDEERRLQEQVNRLQAQLRNAESLSRLKDAAERQGRNIEQDLQQLAELEADFQRLRQALGAANDADRKRLIEESTRQIAELKRKIAALEAGALGGDQDLRNQLARLMAERDQQESQFRHLEADFQQLAAKLRQREDEDATKGSALGYRPCWSEDGKAVKTFDIYVTASGFRISRAWPTQFDPRARATPALIPIITDRLLAIAEFQRLAAPVQQAGREAADGSCVFYAKIINQSDLSVDEFRRREKIIQGYFYPFP